MSFVLDSSVSLTWCFDDERTDATDALLERVVEAGAVAPALWPLEVLNALAMAERRSRIDGCKRADTTALAVDPIPRCREAARLREGTRATAPLASPDSHAVAQCTVHTMHGSNDRTTC